MPWRYVGEVGIDVFTICRWRYVVSFMPWLQYWKELKNSCFRPFRGGWNYKAVIIHLYSRDMRHVACYQITRLNLRSQTSKMCFISCSLWSRHVSASVRGYSNFLAFYLDYGNFVYYLTIWLNGSIATNSNFFLDILCYMVITWRWPLMKAETCRDHKKKLHGLSPRAKYTDRATAASWRSDCQLLRIEGATWSAWRIPTAVFSVF
jgi:hypothetical protein